MLIGGARPERALAQGGAGRIAPERIRAATGKVDDAGKISPEQLEKINAFIRGTADAIRPKN